MMSFDTLFNELCHSLQKTESIREISENFGRLDLNRKVQYAYECLKSQNFLKKVTICGKSVEKSVELRKKGNEMYKQRKVNEALKYYTGSIAHAPPNSEELSLSFGNRSAVLFSLGEYELCLKDIQKAELSYPDSTKYKLTKRKGLCLRKTGSCIEAKAILKEAIKQLEHANLKIKDYERLEHSLKELISEIGETAQDIINNVCEIAYSPETPSCSESFEVSTQIPNASSSIAMKYNDIMGRHIVAKKDINPGEILVIEKPYASILLADMFYTHCAYCFARNVSMIPCNFCSMALYCNEECLKNAWELSHKIECETYSYVMSLNLDKMSILALRILLVASCQGNDLVELMANVEQYESTGGRSKNIGEEYRSSDYKAAHNLEENIDERSIADMFRRSAIAAFLVHALKGSSFFRDQMHVDGFDTKKNLSKVKTNKINLESDALNTEKKLTDVKKNTMIKTENNTLNFENDTLNMDNNTLNVEDNTLNVENDTINMKKSTLNADYSTINLENNTLNADKNSITNTLLEGDHTSNVDENAANMENKALNSANDAFNVDNKTLNVRDTASNVENHTINIEKSTLNVDNKTLNVQVTTSNFENHTINIEKSTLNVDNKTLNVQVTTSNVKNHTINIEKSTVNIENDSINNKLDVKKNELHAEENVSIVENNTLNAFESFAGMLLLKYLCIIPCNAHEISEMNVYASRMESLEIGAALYPVLSLINHSCDPNVVRHSYKDSVVLRCIKPIKVNEQVFDNYGYHYATHSYNMRQERLSAQYYFICECDACAQKWPLYSDLPTKITWIENLETARSVYDISHEKYMKSVEQVRKRKVENQCEVLCQHLSVLSRYVQLPLREFSECQEAIKQCFAMKANYYYNVDLDV